MNRVIAWLRELQHNLTQRLGDWASWQHPVWIVGLVVLGLLLILSRELSDPTVYPSGVMPAAGDTPVPSRKIDPEILAALAKAREDAVSLGQRRLVALLATLNQRVETTFLPSYLSFSRRKLEEIQAYNAYAWSRLKGLVGGGNKDEAIPILVATFQESFDTHVLAPATTRLVLHALGREVAQRYVSQVTLALQDLQEARRVSFTQWAHYLEQIPPTRVELPEKGNLVVPLSALARPDPLRDRLGELIGSALEARFLAYPSVTADYLSMRTPDGRNIFDVGSNAWAYYGSYVVYWIILIFLFRSGFIPINLSGALVGWLIWETFVWGSWIAMESADFEHTRGLLGPVITERAETYFSGLRTYLTDPGDVGPFQLLRALERESP